MPAVEIEPDASGRLSDTPLPRLLLALHRQRFQGELRVSGPRAEKRFVFEERLLRDVHPLDKTTGRRIEFRRFGK